MIEKKQRVAAQRIYERFRQMGCEGKYTQGNEAVRELVRVKRLQGNNVNITGKVDDKGPQ